MIVQLPSLLTKNLLWHYTDFSGLQGMLRDDVMYASHIAYLNDALEFMYTVGIVGNIVEVVCRDLQLYDRGNSNDFLRRVMMWQAAFVSSFSKQADDLSQWRGYTHSSPSFAIGFSRDEMESLGVKLVACEYELQVQQSEIRPIVERHARELEITFKERTDPGARTERFYNQLLSRVGSETSPMSLRNKSPTFRDENEERVIIHLGDLIRSGPVEYRRARSMIVPYVKWKIRAATGTGPSPIKGIIVGPSPHQEQILLATDMMSDQYGIGALVAKSDVPYRF